MHAGPDMAFMQHFMQVAAAGHMDPAAFHMAQYQMAAAQGLNFPAFPGFPPPGIAEQVMAAAQAAAASFLPTCFPQYPSSEQPGDPMVLAQQHAAAQALLAGVFHAQQPHQQSTAHQSSAPPGQAMEAATAAVFAHFAHATSLYHTVSPPASVPADYAKQQQEFAAAEVDQQALLQNGTFSHQQPARPAESTQGDSHGISLLPTRVAVKDDPAFGNGRLYRPHASHAKVSVAPLSVKFGGAVSDAVHSGSVLSRNSSSESTPVPVSCCFEAAGSDANASKRSDDAPAVA